MKMKHETLRKIGLLPNEPINRPKNGFSIPIADWFRGELKEMLLDLLLDGRAKAKRLF